MALRGDNLRKVMTVKNYIKCNASLVIILILPSYYFFYLFSIMHAYDKKLFMKANKLVLILLIIRYNGTIFLLSLLIPPFYK